MKRVAVLFVVIISIGLSACSTTYRTAAKFGDDSDRFIGTVEQSIMEGEGTIHLESSRTDVTCSGTVLYTGTLVATSCVGRGGTLSLECSDGRTIEGSWTINDYSDNSVGCGSGEDSEGRPFEFVFGLSESDVVEYLK